VVTAARAINVKLEITISQVQSPVLAHVLILIYQVIHLPKVCANYVEISIQAVKRATLPSVYLVYQVLEFTISPIRLTVCPAVPQLI
jgi:hypothetical protein